VKEKGSGKRPEATGSHPGQRGDGTWRAVGAAKDARGKASDVRSHGLVVDLFAGGGGASVGIEAALGRPVDIAINHDAVAMAVHKANHPATRHLEADIWEIKPLEATGGQPVDVLWASPDCTHFSVAKGDVPKRQDIRSLAWAVVRWAKAVRPSVIFLENVQEFRGWGPLSADGKPDKARMGQTFKRWKSTLQNLGYVVDYRVLDASHYGAPTRRRRLFMVARCDGKPIQWPAPTHGATLFTKQVRTAAECIDWSLPCPSIFERKRPLADKTMWRIAQGIRRFVLENPRPFIVEMNHSNAPRGTGEPLGTVTTQHNRFNLVAPTLVQTGYGERDGQAARVPGLHKPLGTMVNGQKHALVAAFLAKHFGGVVGTELPQPIGTVTSKDHHSLVSAVMVEPGQRHGRGDKPADDPLSTVVAKDRHAMAAVALAKFRGTRPDQPGSASVEEPLPVISAGGIHVAEVRAFLTAFYGTDGTKGKGQRVDEPARTLTAKHRLGLVTVEGVDYQIVDIGMRMLQPHELLRAQFGRFADTYDLSAARTKAGMVRLIGNSVCPEVAEAVVAANPPAEAERGAA
jgi:DNA (cytosine-5)-methyltransferase 1